jgi:hypothetical protein
LIKGFVVSILKSSGKPVDYGTTGSSSFPFLDCKRYANKDAFFLGLSSLMILVVDEEPPAAFPETGSLSTMG